MGCRKLLWVCMLFFALFSSPVDCARRKHARGEEETEHVEAPKETPPAPRCEPFKTVVEADKRTWGTYSLEIYNTFLLDEIHKTVNRVPPVFLLMSH